MPHPTPTLLAASLVLALVHGAIVAQDAPSGWQTIPLGDRNWSGVTQAVTVADRGLLLHGRDVEVVAPDGSLERLAGVLPRAVEAISAVCVRADGHVVVLPGRGAAAFAFDPKTRASVDLPGLALETGRGARVVDDGRGGLVIVPGNGSASMVRWHDGATEKLPDTEVVNMIGKYSSGLFRLGNQLLANGDHHVSVYELDERRWHGTNKLFFVLGFRPALDRGGCMFQDPTTGAVLALHGKDSRALGVLLPQRQFHYLRPRLPVGVRDPGQCLFVTGTGADTHMCVLSQQHGAIFRIPLSKLEPVTTQSREVERGSRWQVWNLLPNLGAIGDLVRERDSVGHTIFLDPYVYVQRKNMMRSIHYDQWRHSDWNGAPEFGRNFAIKGANICSDGRFVYVANGYSNEFFALDLHTTEAKVAKPERVHINEALVRPLAPLRTFPAGTNNDDLPRNMTMVCHRSRVYALRDPVTRMLHEYDPATNRWSDVGLIPTAMDYTDDLGADLLSDGERLILLSGNSVATWTEAAGFGPVHRLGFAYTANGGMAVYDPVERLVYVAIGGGSRDAAVVDPQGGSHRVLRDFFPDAVSVHGRRLFLVERDGTRWLNIQRGHDSQEFWRTSISGEGRLVVGER